MMNQENKSTLLHFPWRRQELISWLKDLAYFENTKEIWISNKAVSPICSFYTFLEDQMLSFDYPYEQIEYSLYNKEEVEAVKKVAVIFDKVVEEQESSLNHPVLRYINSPLWDNVISSSQAAYDLLVSNNKKYGLDLRHSWENVESW